MNMQMENRLSTVTVGIYDDSVTVVRKASVARDLTSGHKQMTKGVPVLGGRLRERIDMFARDEQEMSWRLRADVAESDADIILINHGSGNFARDNPAK
jgi:hypothetical protein